MSLMVIHTKGSVEECVLILICEKMFLVIWNDKEVSVLGESINNILIFISFPVECYYNATQKGYNSISHTF